MKEKAMILVVDCGTSTVRASSVKADDGTLVRGVAAPFDWLHPAENRTEIDPRQIWKAAQQAVAGVIVPGGPPVEAVTFSFFGDNVVPVEGNGANLSHLLPAFDARAQSEAEAFMEQVDFGRHWEITGGPIASMNVSSKILWLKAHAPQVFAQTKYFYDIQQYILSRLGLEAVNDYTMASRKMLFDIHAQRWSPLLLEAVGISADALGPGIVDSASIIGTIDTFGEVKLPSVTPVVIGAHDFVCGLIGLGAIAADRGFAAEIIGTMDLMGYLSDRPVSSLVSFCGPQPGMYATMMGVPTSGALLEWYLSSLTRQDRSQKGIFERLFAAATFDGRARLFTLPQFDASRGCIYGLDLATDQTAIFQSMVEGLAYDARGMLDLVDQSVEGGLGTLHVGGGGARSDKLLQLRADISGKRIGKASNPEVSTLGAAILAAIALGVHVDLAEAFDRMGRIERYFEPNPEIAERYRSGYAVFQALKQALLAIPSIPGI